jgi:hypothetical protein
MVDQGAVSSAELVVEADAGSHAREAPQDARSESAKGASTVAFGGQRVFAGPQDPLDGLTDRREMQVRPGLVVAAGAHDGGVQLADGVSEFPAGVASVTQQDLASGAPASGKQLEDYLTVVTLGRDERERAHGAVGGEDRAQPKAPELPGARGAFPVVGDSCGRTQPGSNRSAADRPCNRASGGQRRASATGSCPPGAGPLEVPGVRGHLGTQVAQTLGSDFEATTIARDPPPRSRHTEREDPRVGDHTTAVSGRFWHEVVNRATKGNAPSAEVGVHRGPRVGDAGSTAHFGLSVQDPVNTVSAVESII